MNYLTKKYILYMGINSCLTSCQNVISTNSMLTSIFVNPSSVANLSYISKDILGQVGGLLYSWKSGKNADKKPLKHIIKGSFIQQFGFHLENASVLIKDENFIIPFLGLSSITKNVSFISIGAVNSNNLNKLSKKDKNIGELYSKISSINTLSSSIGMLLGMGIIFFIPSYTVKSYIILPLLSIGSLYCIKKGTEEIK
jgi:hypothetical protein